MKLPALLLACCSLLLCACTLAPIYTVTDAPVVVVSSRQVSLDGVRDAILRAGGKLGWQMNPVESGVINCRISLRGHTAAVDVRYNVKTYSIVYRDSTNLEYRDGQIHKNYNGWIQNLDREIRTELLQG